jgi:hypothetical protein
VRALADAEATRDALLRDLVTSGGKVGVEGGEGGAGGVPRPAVLDEDKDGSGGGERHASAARRTTPTPGTAQSSGGTKARVMVGSHPTPEGEVMAEE